MTKHKEQLEFISKLYDETPDVILGNLQPGSLREDATELMRLARRHGRLQERRCNEDIGEEGEKADELLEARISFHVTRPSLRGSIKTVTFGGDPRGYTVKVQLLSGACNTWGGAEEGWGVPQ